MFRCKLLGGRIEIAHVQNDTDIAVAENRTTGNAVALDIEAVDVAGQRLHHDLLFAQKFVNKQAVRGVFTGFQPDENTVLHFGTALFN